MTNENNAATLKAAQGGVTGAMVAAANELRRADDLARKSAKIDRTHVVGRVADKHLAVILSALSAQQGQGEADLAGYVDPEQVADMKRNGGGVSIGSFSERYGRTVPVYFHPAPPAQPAARVPEGWVLVPREPTQEMAAAGGAYDAGDSYYATSEIGEDAAKEVWKAMLAASPAPRLRAWMGVRDEGAFF